MTMREPVDHRTPRDELEENEEVHDQAEMPADALRHILSWMLDGKSLALSRVAHINHGGGMT